ncbi:MAG: hypothetical protein LBQ36_05015 [Synergistaceae bacterium]|jgi:hypothetical protein|nr:hypothetical protein [Synergistaceae bacterium]
MKAKLWVKVFCALAFCVILGHAASASAYVRVVQTYAAPCAAPVVSMPVAVAVPVAPVAYPLVVGYGYYWGGIATVVPVSSVAYYAPAAYAVPAVAHPVTVPTYTIVR